MLLRFLLQALACSGLLAATYGAWLTPNRFHGQVLVASDTWLCLLIAGEEVRFCVAPGAQATIDGRLVPFRNLRPHHQATVVYERTGRIFLAHRVTASVKTTWIEPNTAHGLVWYEQQTSSVFLQEDR